MPDQMVRVWDLPVRLVHWSLVLLVAFQIYSGNVGGNLMRWHMLAGYAILAVVLFRLAWGVAGSTTARFSQFLAGPRAALGFARRLWSRAPTSFAGHNPVGGWMVLALLALLAVQAGSGLFANDDISTEGPLAVLVSKATSDRMTAIHHVTQKLLLALISLHVLAVLYHWRVLKENLIRAMFTGVKRLPAELAQEMSAVRFASSWRALGLLVAAAVLVWLLVSKTFLKP
jgi:cytochrome b